MFTGPLTESILKRARQAGLVEVRLHNIRDYATDHHHTADDAPYGGGAGMVMKAEPMAAAIRTVVAMGSTADEGNRGAEEAAPLVVLMSPDGQPFTQAMAEELQSWWSRLVLVCGRYEGVDERVRVALIDREVSIGDYVLTGGELAAMVVVDAVTRLVPGVLDPHSISEESHSEGLLEYPHYTRPAVWEGRAVPPVLLSGHHGEVAKWRRWQQVRRTLARRPDLFVRAGESGALTAEDLANLMSPAEEVRGEGRESVR